MSEAEIRIMDVLTDNLLQIIAKNSKIQIQDIDGEECREEIEKYLTHMIATFMIHNQKFDFLKDQ